MYDLCEHCWGTGDEDGYSGMACIMCNGTGWRDDRDDGDDSWITDDEMDFWDGFYAEQEAREEEK